MKRGDVCGKFKRYCVACGTKQHLNAAKRGECPDCGANHWTRDSTKVKA